MKYYSVGIKEKFKNKNREEILNVIKGYLPDNVLRIGNVCYKCGVPISIEDTYCSSCEKDYIDKSKELSKQLDFLNINYYSKICNLLISEMQSILSEVTFKYLDDDKRYDGSEKLELLSDILRTFKAECNICSLNGSKWGLYNIEEEIKEKLPDLYKKGFVKMVKDFEEHYLKIVDLNDKVDDYKSNNKLSKNIIIELPSEIDIYDYEVDYDMDYTICAYYSEYAELKNVDKVLKDIEQM